MKKNYIIWLTVPLFALACNSPQEQSINNAVSTDTNTMQIFKNEHTAQKSLDWTGAYEGIIPCADCEGIKTTIILNDDGTFSSREEYLKSKNILVETKGNFIWDDSGFKVTLEDAQAYKRTFKVIENAIILMDIDGNEIKGSLSDHYILQKK